MSNRTIASERALTEYFRSKREPFDSVETGIVDLMTDLMHLAKKSQLDGVRLARMAEMHFMVEDGDLAAT